jgi:hypothetical protein
MTIPAAEVRINLPIHRLIGKHPQEIYQYLTYVVIPVLVDGLVKRALHPHPGLTVSTDQRECVAEITL